jgi:group I intron endonuclease
MLKTEYSTDQLLQTGIYAILNKVNDKRYIGSAARSFRDRWGIHYREMKRGFHSNIYLQNAWDKYGEEAFDFIILEIVPKEEWTDSKYLTDVEQMWLDAFQPAYNISPTAGSRLGVVHSEETRQKMSEFRKGKKLSEEHKRKISEACKGRKHPPKTLEQLTKFAEAVSLTWRVFPPKGESFIIRNLKKFCRESNLDPGNLASTAKYPSRKCKGYRVEKISEETMN